VLLNERSEFIQNVSHQLKTPLAILLGTLSKKSVSDQDINEVKKEISHLAKVVDDLLILALIDTNPNLPLRPENMMEIISNAIEMTGPKAAVKKISINFNVNESLHDSSLDLERPVMGDLFVSALMNIIDNAIDFSPVGEIVEIHLFNRDDRLVIKIKDNGPGISEDILPNLFKRFTRGNLNRKGTGLGLSISKKIIDLHKGEIRISEHRIGTTFEIIL
jgi:signal transduction histidine kinase